MTAGKIAVAAAAIGALLAGALYASGVFVTDRAVAAPDSQDARGQRLKETGPNNGRGSGNGPGGGGCACCNKKSGQLASPAEEALRLATAYYSQAYGDKDFTVEVKDFGCHQEATVIKGGKPVKLLSISNGEVREVQ